jgi:hypothetical protein
LKCSRIYILASVLIGLIFTYTSVSFYPTIIDLWNTNLGFYFMEDLVDYKKYYPNFYFFLYLGSRIIKYSFPLFLVFILFKLKRNWSNIFPFNLSFKTLKELSGFLLIQFVINLLIIVIIYFLVIALNTNFNAQLRLSRAFLLIQLISLSCLLLKNNALIKQSVQNAFEEPVPPYNLALTRIVFFSYAIFLYIFVFYNAPGTFSGLERVPLPGLAWLIQIWPVSTPLYSGVCALGAFSALMVIIGYKTRFFLILSCFTVFYVDATPNFFGKLWHHQILIWITWVLAVSPCFDVFSIDSKLEKKQLFKSSIYNYHLSIIFLFFGLIYFFAGFFKLWNGGLDWALSESMINQVRLEWFENGNRMPSIRIDKVPFLLKAGGLLVIVFELSFIFLISNKRTRWIAVIGGLTMHNFIGYFMNIGFFVFLQAFYLVFIPWNAIIAKFKSKKAKLEVSDQKTPLKSLSFILPLIILFSNLGFSIFNISSYPFSAYPSYHDIVPSTFKYLEFKIQDVNSKNIDLWEQAKINHFRWESFSRFEPSIVQNYLDSNRIDSSKIEQQWLHWRNGLGLSDDIDSVQVYAVEIYLEPEKQEDTIYKQYIYTIESRPYNEQ